jgi:hypothetical protein
VICPRQAPASAQAIANAVLVARKLVGSLVNKKTSRQGTPER